MWLYSSVGNKTVEKIMENTSHRALFLKRRLGLRAEVRSGKNKGTIITRTNIRRDRLRHQSAETTNICSSSRFMSASTERALLYAVVGTSSCVIDDGITIPRTQRPQGWFFCSSYPVNTITWLVASDVNYIKTV